MATKRIEYENDLADLMSFNVYHTVRNRALYVFILFFAVLMHREAVRLGDGPAMQAAILSLWIAIYVFFIFVMTGLNVLLNYKRAHNKTIFGRHVMTLTDENVSETTELSSTSYSWKAVARIGRNRRLLMIYAQSNLAFLVPRRAFGTEEEAADFERFALECRRKAADA